jgi:hypothetical protein
MVMMQARKWKIVEKMKQNVRFSYIFSFFKGLFRNFVPKNSKDQLS